MKRPSQPASFGDVVFVAIIASLVTALVTVSVFLLFQRRQSLVDVAQWRSIDAAGLAGGCRCRDADDPVPSPRSSSGPSRPSVR